MLAIGTKLKSVRLDILQAKLVCLQQGSIVYAYQCFDSWRHSAMVGSHEHFIPHGNRFANDFGDGGVESRVPLGMQVVDV